MNYTEIRQFDNSEVLSPKEMLWQTTVEKVNHITDRVGMPIDAGIKDTVVTLMVHGFPTSQSCEGHPEQHDLSYPWVEIYTPEPNNWKNDESKKETWQIENLKQQQKMIEYLSEFYQDRKTPFEAQLCIHYIGAFGGFRIHSTGAETMSLSSPTQQQEKFNLYRQEIISFSQFLKDKFFSE